MRAVPAKVGENDKETSRAISAQDYEERLLKAESFFEQHQIEVPNVTPDKYIRLYDRVS